MTLGSDSRGDEHQTLVWKMRQKFNATKLLLSGAYVRRRNWISNWKKNAALWLIASSIGLSTALTSRHAAASSSDLPSLHVRQLLVERSTSPTMLSCIYIPGPPHRMTPSNTHTQVPHLSSCQSRSGRARLLPSSQRSSRRFSLVWSQFFCQSGGWLNRLNHAGVCWQLHNKCGLNKWLLFKDVCPLWGESDATATITSGWCFFFAS